MRRVLHPLVLALLVLPAIWCRTSAQQAPDSPRPTAGQSGSLELLLRDVLERDRALMRTANDPQGKASLPKCGASTPAALGPAQPVPGDPQGRMGWPLDSQFDDQGNKYEIWCLQLAGGAGNSYGARYIPKVGTPVWIGKCPFVGGRNSHGKNPTSDTNRNGEPDGWAKITWNSEDNGGGGPTDPKDDDKDSGKKDYHWEYDPRVNVLKRWETNDGRRLHPDSPEYNGPGLSDFGGLLAINTPGDLTNDDMAESMVAVMYADGVPMPNGPGTLWRYQIAADNLVEHTSTILKFGDRLSVAASGVYLAAAPPSWVIIMTPTYVTWEYRGPDLNLSTSVPITGFQISSTAPSGTMNWIAYSAASNGTFDMDGSLPGPQYVAGARPSPSVINGNLSVYPNPVHGSFVSEFLLLSDADVTMELYDIEGKLVRKLYGGHAEAEKLHRVQVPEGILTPGTYIVKLRTGEEVHVQKIVVVE